MQQQGWGGEPRFPCTLEQRMLWQWLSKGEPSSRLEIRPLTLSSRAVPFLPVISSSCAVVSESSPMEAWVALSRACGFSLANSTTLSCGRN